VRREGEGEKSAHALPREAGRIFFFFVSFFVFRVVHNPVGRLSRGVRGGRKGGRLLRPKFTFSEMGFRLVERAAVPLSLSLSVSVTVGGMKFSLTAAGGENSASRISRCSTRSMRRYNSGKSPVAGSQKTPGIRLFSFRDTLASRYFHSLLVKNERRGDAARRSHSFARARARAHERLA